MFPLEYQEAGTSPPGSLEASISKISEETTPIVIGVPEEEVERRIQIARDGAIAEAEHRIRMECECVNNRAREKITEVINKFDSERAEYFRRVESQIAQLSLAIARKILQREAELDPTLLVALVRIALDQMQCESLIRIRVSAEDVDQWRRCESAKTDIMSWEIIADETLNVGDCVVETELGTANFGFEAQLRDVQEGFAQLLACRPTSRSHDAATS